MNIANESEDDLPSSHKTTDIHFCIEVPGHFSPKTTTPTNNGKIHVTVAGEGNLKILPTYTNAEDLICCYLIPPTIKIKSQLPSEWKRVKTFDQHGYDEITWCEDSISYGKDGCKSYNIKIIIEHSDIVEKRSIEVVVYNEKLSYKRLIQDHQSRIGSGIDGIDKISVTNYAERAVNEIMQTKGFKLCNTPGDYFPLPPTMWPDRRTEMELKQEFFYTIKTGDTEMKTKWGLPGLLMTNMEVKDVIEETIAKNRLKTATEGDSKDRYKGIRNIWLLGSNEVFLEVSEDLYWTWIGEINCSGPLENSEIAERYLHEMLHGVWKDTNQGLNRIDNVCKGLISIVGDLTEIFLKDIILTVSQEVAEKYPGARSMGDEWWEVLGKHCSSGKRWQADICVLTDTTSRLAAALVDDTKYVPRSSSWKEDMTTIRPIIKNILFVQNEFKESVDKLNQARNANAHNNSQTTFSSHFETCSIICQQVERVL